MLAVPIDNMLYIYLLCPHSEHQNNPFQSKQSGSIKAKLPKVGSNAIVPVPVGAGPDKWKKSVSSVHMNLIPGF
jgi:hypothetical protein